MGSTHTYRYTVPVNNTAATTTSDKTILGTPPVRYEYEFEDMEGVRIQVLDDRRVRLNLTQGDVAYNLTPQQTQELAKMLISAYVRVTTNGTKGT